MVDLFPVALLVLWLTPVYFIVVNYRSVVHRRRHMIDTLTRSPKGDGQYTPAQHYLNLFAPSWDGKENVEEFLKGEFDRLHGRFWRYCTSTGLLVIVSLIAIEILLDGIGIQILPLHQLVTFGNPELHPGKVPAVVPSLAGAYVASVIELYIRTRAGDLTPEEIDEVTMRQLLAVPLGKAAFAMGELNLAAFVVPAVPLKDILRYMRKRALEKAGAASSPEQGDGLISKRVDGLGSEAIARLEELGITTSTDLAYANPIRILAKTGFSLRLIVQWIDHALLSVYARSHKTKLRDGGIPCALDAKEFWSAHFASPDYVNFPDYNCPTVQAFSAKVGVDALLIREMFQRVAIDPHVTFLETLWYTGYLGNRVEPPRCSWHTEGPTLGGAGPQPRTPPGAPDPTFVPPEDQPS